MTAFGVVSATRITGNGEATLAHRLKARLPQRMVTRMMKEWAMRTRTNWSNRCFSMILASRRWRWKLHRPRRPTPIWSRRGCLKCNNLIADQYVYHGTPLFTATLRHHQDQTTSYSSSHTYASRTGSTQAHTVSRLCRRVARQTATLTRSTVYSSTPTPILALKSSSQVRKTGASASGISAREDSDASSKACTKAAC